MTDATRVAVRKTRAARTTSTWIWLGVLAVASLLLVARLPLFIAVAEDSLAQASAALDDPAMSSTAIAVGAAAAIALHAVGIALIAALASLLERFLGPRALGGGVRIGVGGLTLTVLVLGQQLAATLGATAAIARGWPLWTAAAVVILAAPLLFPESRGSARSYGSALLVSGAIGGLLCIG